MALHVARAAMRERDLQVAAPRERPRDARREVVGVILRVVAHPDDVTELRGDTVRCRDSRCGDAAVHDPSATIHGSWAAEVQRGEERIPDAASVQTFERPD